MVETDFMKLYEELSTLMEVQGSMNFTDGPEDKYYHFYEDLADLVNSLRTRRIYSNKNINSSQLDIYAAKDQAYVCMTIGKEGKQRTAQNFGTRPFGLSFKDLDKLCQNRNYTFDSSEDGKYSQFLAKTQYSLTRNGRTKGAPTQASENKDITAFRDFELLAIGELDGDFAGYYFISGGQGRNLNNHWSSKLFTDAKLYKTLKDWFLWNMRDRWADYDAAKDEPKTPRPYRAELAIQPHIYYHFVDNNLGEPIADYVNVLNKRSSSHVLNTTGNLNTKYMPWVDKKGTDKHEAAMDFKFKVQKTAFKEIIGLGPFMVKDNVGNILLQMDLCNPSQKGGYQPPKLFSTLADTLDAASTYKETDQYSPGRTYSLHTTIPNKESNPAHLLMSYETAKAMADLYNESEYRVYIPGKKDFAFAPDDIETIVLPALITTAQKHEVNLQNLITVLLESQSIPTDKTEFIDFLLQAEVIKSIDISEHTFKNLLVLVQLLITEYNNVMVELIEGQNAKSLLLNTPYAKTGKEDAFVTSTKGKVKKSGKLRLKTNLDIMQQIQDPVEVLWRGVQSVVATLPDFGGNARLGAETILIGKDEADNKYVLFVDNAHKASDFLELPGGGLHNLPVKFSDFEAIAKQRLQFKGGLDLNKIKNLTDTGFGLLLDEDAVALDKQITWNWSYYRLFTAYYTDILNSEDTDYSVDNTQFNIIKAKGEDGYTCYLKWIPVDSLDSNRALVSRYSNIFELIRTTAATFN